MILEITFLTGRFHATAWGRHVNEALPEWPPSPFRLLRAAMDAWFRKHPEIPAEVVERLFAALSAPPRCLLPRARASHTRSYLSQNGEDPTDKKLVFDGFAVLDRDSKVLVGWPGVKLDPACLDAAHTLFGAINYLGRSESWVEARVLDDHEVAWNCEPLVPGTVPADKEVVNVAGVVTPEAFESRAFTVPAKGKTKARTLPWLEALGWGSAEAIDLKMNRPPALEPLFYLREVAALDARPTPVRRASKRVVEAVRFAVEGKVKAPITDALIVAEQVHRNLMGSLKRILGSERLPPTLSGRDAEGRPMRGHGHASVLPLDDDGDGFIDALLISAPSALTAQEQRALEQLHPVWRRNGHPLVLTPLRSGTRADLTTGATTLTTLTPFVPTQHFRFKRDGDLASWVEGQLRLECERRNLPRPLKIRALAAPEISGRRARWLDFRRARKDDAPRLGFGLSVTFSQPVHAPFSLGYASHYGLGCFVPT